jgi:hypothetical protein
MSFENKYLKYKGKYFNALNNQKGGYVEIGDFYKEYGTKMKLPRFAVNERYSIFYNYVEENLGKLIYNQGDGNFKKIELIEYLGIYKDAIDSLIRKILESNNQEYIETLKKSKLYQEISRNQNLITIKYAWYNSKLKAGTQNDKDISHDNFYSSNGISITPGKQVALINGVNHLFDSGPNWSGTNLAITNLGKNLKGNNNYFFNLDDCVKINDILKISDNSLLTKSTQVINIKSINATYPAGTVIYCEPKDITKVKGVYHLKGINLTGLPTPETEKSIFDVVFSYYYVILDHFSNHSNTEFIYLPPVPGFTFEGTLITEVALYKAVKKFIETYKGTHKITIILGIKENIESTNEYNFFEKNKDYNSLITNALKTRIIPTPKITQTSDNESRASRSSIEETDPISVHESGTLKTRIGSTPKLVYESRPSRASIGTTPTPYYESRPSRYSIEETRPELLSSNARVTTTPKYVSTLEPLDASRGVITTIPPSILGPASIGVTPSPSTPITSIVATIPPSILGPASIGVTPSPSTSIVATTTPPHVTAILPPEPSSSDILGMIGLSNSDIRIIKDTFLNINDIDIDIHYIKFGKRVDPIKINELKNLISNIYKPNNKIFMQSGGTPWENDTPSTLVDKIKKAYETLLFIKSGFNITDNIIDYIIETLNNFYQILILLLENPMMIKLEPNIKKHGNNIKMKVNYDINLLTAVIKRYNMHRGISQSN